MLAAWERRPGEGQTPYTLCLRAGTPLRHTDMGYFLSIRLILNVPPLILNLIQVLPSQRYHEPNHSRRQLEPGQPAFDLSAPRGHKTSHQIFETCPTHDSSVW